MFVLIVIFWIVAVSQGALSASGTPVTYESALWCFWEVTTRRPRLLLILFVFKVDSQTHYNCDLLKSDCKSGRRAFQMKEPNSHFLPSKVDENT